MLPSIYSFIHLFTHSQVCVAAIAQTECILSLKKCMENEKDLIATCCETLTRLFKCQHVSTETVEKKTTSMLIFLLSLSPHNSLLFLMLHETIIVMLCVRSAVLTNSIIFRYDRIL